MGTYGRGGTSKTIGNEEPQFIRKTRDKKQMPQHEKKRYFGEDTIYKMYNNPLQERSRKKLVYIFWDRYYLIGNEQHPDKVDYPIFIILKKVLEDETPPNSTWTVTASACENRFPRGVSWPSCDNVLSQAAP
uniref:Uncharacterized protein n=1 Tax=Oryza sativa subsp. japonica TaxID=39947 RepID=Q2R0T1_ORYSJ|nr:hypothetical protein LOC_Os11g41520 [Oryza sativa Japonica Group]